MNLCQDLPRRGRSVDPEFHDSEYLYWRFEPDPHAPDEVPLDRVGSGKQQFRLMFPTQSVNRSKYSQPPCVLLDDWPKYAMHAVAAFRVFDVPARVSGEGSEIDFLIVHVPLEHNYAHAEIHSMFNGELKTPSKTKKRAFRAKLAQSMRVVMRGGDGPQVLGMPLSTDGR